MKATKSIMMPIDLDETDETLGERIQLLSLAQPLNKVCVCVCGTLCCADPFSD